MWSHGGCHVIVKEGVCVCVYVCNGDCPPSWAMMNGQQSGASAQEALTNVTQRGPQVMIQFACLEQILLSSHPVASPNSTALKVGALVFRLGPGCVGEYVYCNI